MYIENRGGPRTVKTNVICLFYLAMPGFIHWDIPHIEAIAVIFHTFCIYGTRSDMSNKTIFEQVKEMLFSCDSAVSVIKRLHGEVTIGVLPTECHFCVVINRSSI